MTRYVAASPAATPGGSRQRYPTPEHVKELRRYADNLFSDPNSGLPAFRSDNAPAGGRPISRDTSPATPELVSEFQPYADDLFSDPDSGLPAFGSDNAPAGGRPISWDTSPATPEFFKEFQRYAENVFSGPDAGLPVFGSDNAPAGGRQIAAPDPNVAEITEGMGRMRSPSGSGGGSPHPAGGSPSYGGADEGGKRRALGQPSGSRPRRIPRLGPPDVSGPSRHAAGQPVARTSRTVPVAAAPFAHTIPTPVFPPVDSDGVAWALSDDVHPIFLPPNEGLRPRNLRDLPQDALDNFRHAIGTMGKNDGQKVAMRYNFMKGSISNWRRNGVPPFSRTGQTMINLDPRPANFGTIMGKGNLSVGEAALLEAQFGRGHNIAAIAAHFQVPYDTVAYYRGRK